MKKKKESQKRSHRWSVLKSLGLILLAAGLLMYLFNIQITALTLLSPTPWDGGGSAASNSFTLRSLVILGLIVVGILLILFG